MQKAFLHSGKYFMEKKQTEYHGLILLALLMSWFAIIVFLLGCVVVVLDAIKERIKPRVFRHYGTVVRVK